MKFLLVLLLIPALAVTPSERLSDPGLESRARALSRELRCVVCQNESIDESNATLARDIRILLRERLSAGDTDAQVTAFLVARYGDFILLRPPLRADTWLLWFAPPALLALGALAAFAALRRRAAAAAPPPLTATEQLRLEALLREGKP